MLCSYSYVDKEGNFEVRGDLRSLYGVMSSIRILVTVGSAEALQKAVLVATRYAACRRQFKNQKNNPLERKLIDY